MTTLFEWFEWLIIILLFYILCGLVAVTIILKGIQDTTRASVHKLEQVTDAILYVHKNDRQYIDRIIKAKLTGKPLPPAPAPAQYSGDDGWVTR